MRRSAPGATSSEREGRSPGYCCCSIEDNGNHNARSRLSCVGPAAATRGSRWCGEARSHRPAGGEGGKRRAGRWRVRGRRCGGEARPRLGRRGTAMDLNPSGLLRHRIDMVAGSANCHPAAACTASVWWP
ncbi:hypothetical protein PVAP13_9KG413800 [Panicum virgatum]|uniref:Uncharacterized protein n=1 Tax=Panicum virgatum TaxID=38727 RepID=A0A8T0NYG9_PANVG|nr:hypothetical protein PVAP13_9KG413800 [Panicum virgatum]